LAKSDAAINSSFCFSMHRRFINHNYPSAFKNFDTKLKIKSIWSAAKVQ